MKQPILTDGHLTLARASRAASASAAMALCNWTGRRTSLLQAKERKFHPRLPRYYNNHCRAVHTPILAPAAVARTRGEAAIILCLELSSHTTSRFWLEQSLDIVPGGAGGAIGRSVTLISTRVGKLCPPNNNGTPGFSDFPTALTLTWLKLAAAARWGYA